MPLNQSFGKLRDCLRLIPLRAKGRLQFKGYHEKKVRAGTKKVKAQRNPENYFETFEDLIKNLKTIIDNIQTIEAIAEVLDDDKMIFKITKCKWAEMLRDLDPEFGFAMLCSTDYEQAKNYNPDFVLTRNNTLMEGDDYCDFCYHDTRTEKEITHPTDQFWKEYS